MRRLPAILSLNAGSSSLKFAVHSANRGGTHTLQRVCSGQFSRLDGEKPSFTLCYSAGETREERLPTALLARTNPEDRFGYLVDLLLSRLSRAENGLPRLQWLGAGHRVVHGGTDFTAPVRLTAERIQRLKALVPLAPLHQPPGLAVIAALEQHLPNLPQVACFDTAFHRSMPGVEQGYALPREWFARGVRRYGFHGLSYEYIASILPQQLDSDRAEGRVVVAHLGHGASLCAMRGRRSMATTMGFTPLDGVPMATRPGAIDPGLATWLIARQGLSVEQVEDLFNHHSGLLGLSGLSGDVELLQQSPEPAARDALEYFVHHVHRALGSMAAAINGLDVLVFTGGIGEHSAWVRERICEQADWLGIRLDPLANRQHRACISAPDSPVTVLVLPTDEERRIAEHTVQCLETGSTQEEIR